MTAAASAVIYLIRGGIDPYVAGPTAIGVFVGATVGSRLGHRIGQRQLRVAFVLVLLYTAVEMARRALADLLRRRIVVAPMAGGPSTTELVVASPLAAGSSASFALVPGRTIEIPIAVAAGETISLQTSSKDFWDTILVLLAPNGTPVVGSDDFKGYMAGLDWVAPAGGTYRLRVTSFEAVDTGTLLVARK